MPDVPQVWIERGITIVLVLAVAVVGRWLLVRSIAAITARALERAQQRRSGKTRADRILAAATGASDERYDQRARTMSSLLRSITNTAIVIIAVLTVLAVLQVPLAPLLASAGVGGIALAFGAQSLVKDFLSGIFMILEDQYGVGDLIDTGTLTGTVEEVGLRVTKVRDPGGEVWYVRNGEILQLGNRSQGWSTALVDVPIGNDEDATRALAIIQQVVDTIEESGEFADVLLDKPTVAGVEEVTPTGTTLRVVAKTAPNQQWGVKRALLQRSIHALGEAGYHGPVAIGLPPSS